MPPVPAGQKERDDLVEAAMRLRDEQLRARVIYVDPDAETNAELDAITERVVAELQALQMAGISARVEKQDPAAVERELTSTLRGLLEKLVSPRREHFLRHKIELVQRRIANLYFSSEIGVQTTRRTKTLQFSSPDEALHAAFQKFSPILIDEIQSYQYADPQTPQVAISRLQRFEKRLAAAVLAQSRPELEGLLRIFREIMLLFLLRDFRAALPTFAHEVIRTSQVARGHDLTYKIQTAQFPRFRRVFEQLFMQRLLKDVQAPLATKIEESKIELRPETVHFAANPRIYADICAVTCNAIYDYLYGEGFLDLPVEWQRLTQE